MEKISVEKARELARQALRWAASADGQQQLLLAATRADETTNELEEAQRVDPQKLSEPFTV